MLRIFKVCFLSFFIFIINFSSIATAEEMFGLSQSGRLIRFDTSSPSTLISSQAVTGLNSGDTLIGIDFRPATGELIGVGSQSLLYKIDPTTAVATVISTGAFSTPLSGATFGIDFNPTVDRLRIVSDTAQNLRINPSTGALAAADTALAYSAVDANSGVTPHVVSVAYTNNLTSSASTVLYGIDSSLDTLVRIGGANGTPSPNAGTVFTLASLGINTSDSVGFDISGLTSTAFVTLALNGESTSGLYEINLVSGSLTSLGTIAGSEKVIDISIPTTPVSILWGASTTDITKLPAESPSIAAKSFTVTGLQGAETILGIDFRPANGTLYLLGSTSRLYTVNLSTGAATQVGSAGAFTLTGTNFGFDFNPTVDRIRVVSDADENLRLNPDTGALAATDTNLSYATGDTNDGVNPNIVAAAYTNNFAGATTTSLFGIDSNLDVLTSHSSPNTGIMTTTAALGTVFGDNSGLDIASGLSYAYANTSNSLYLLNLTSGSVLSAGTMAAGIIDISAAPTSSFQFSATTATVGEGAGNASLTVSRSGSTSGTSYVSYSTTAGTATTSDFTSTSGTLTFVDGESSKTISIPITNDALIESGENFTVTLSGVNGGYLGTNTTTTVTIGDNEDTDGDGFSDDVENAFGTNPNDSASTPFGGAGPGTAKSIGRANLDINLNFSRNNRDTISFRGKLSLGSSFKTKRKRFVIDVGGVVKAVTLNDRGRGSRSGILVNVGTSGKKRDVTVNLTRGNFEEALADEGLVNATIRETKTVVVNIYLNGKLFSSTRRGTYVGIANRSGVF